MASSHVPWTRTNTLAYGAYGTRQVLIIFSDVPLPDCSDAVARRDGHLTDEDIDKLKSENVLLRDSEWQNEVDIVCKRYELDKKKAIFKVLQSKQESKRLLLREEAYEMIAALINNIENDGVVLYYVGAGRKNTGDWCFSNGYITFRDIAELYLQAPHLKGRVLTIVSDCSYSGCWVNDCERFLDYHGVQPCGHKAKEKGMLIKVYASCLPSQIPTRYQLTVHGGGNDKKTGDKYTESSKYLLDTQHTFSMNSSRVRCHPTATIDNPCIMKRWFTWQKLREFNRIYVETQSDKHAGQSCWYYIIKLTDDEDIIHKVKHGELQALHNGQVIRSGIAENLPDLEKVRKSIWKEYGPS